MRLRRDEELIALGIESTAHTFGIGIITSQGNVLANEKHTYRTEKEGIHPMKAAQHHSEVAKEVLQNALEKANLSIRDIDLIAVSIAPGLGPCLRVGATIARALAVYYKKPIVGVHHLVGHIEIGKLDTKARDPLTLLVSGANTQLIAFKAGKYRVFGETLDIGLGNALDVFGRELGIGFPAGPELDRRYFFGKEYIELPYTVKGVDIAYSGVMTAAIRKAKEVENIDDLIYSYLHTIFAMTTEVAERLLAHTEKDELLLTGGVAASKAFREMLEKMCKARGCKFYVPRFEFCMDNGLQIAWTGLLKYKSQGSDRLEDIVPKPYQRIEEVEIPWMVD